MNEFVFHHSYIITPKEFIERWKTYCPECNDFIIETSLSIIEKMGFDSLDFITVYTASFVVITKIFSDFYQTNSYYSNVGGLTPVQLDRLEKVFVDLLYHSDVRLFEFVKD